MKHENNYDGKTDRPCIRQTPAVSLLALRSKLLILNAAREDSLRSEEHTSELQSQSNLVCRLLLEKKKMNDYESSLMPIITHHSSLPLSVYSRIRFSVFTSRFSKSRVSNAFSLSTTQSSPCVFRLC